MPLIEDTRGQLPFSHQVQWAAPAAPVVVAALLVCILQPLAVAGLKGMWKALGTTGSSAKKDREDRLRVVSEGKACGVELADRALDMGAILAVCVVLARCFQHGGAKRGLMLQHVLQLDASLLASEHRIVVQGEEWGILFATLFVQGVRKMHTSSSSSTTAGAPHSRA